MSRIFSLQSVGIDFRVCSVEGLSDISMARQLVARDSLQYEGWPDCVFWLDDDIIFKPETVLEHCNNALSWDVPITGAYMTRKGNQTAFTFRNQVLQISDVRLRAVWSGLGALAIPAHWYYGDIERAPVQKLDGRPLICVPKVTHDQHGAAEYWSEDYAYTDNLGVYIQADSEKVHLYGHEIKTVAWPKLPPFPVL